LPKAGQVKLQIFSVTGQMVQSLVNEYQDAGYHSVAFDASEIPSGVYFYRISGGNQHIVKKMVILK